MFYLIRIALLLLLSISMVGLVNAETDTTTAVPPPVNITRHTPPANIPPVSVAKTWPAAYNNNTTWDAKLDQFAKTNNIPLNTVTADGKCWDVCKATLTEAMNKQGTQWTNAQWTTAASLDQNNSKDTNNLLWVEAGKLRKWDVNMQTIVEVILNVIGFLLGIAGTVAIFSLIYHAVKMQLSSGITGDSSWVESAKKWMIGAVIGFVIAISAWFLVTRIVQLLVEVS